MPQKGVAAASVTAAAAAVSFLREDLHVNVVGLVGKSFVQMIGCDTISMLTQWLDNKKEKNSLFCGCLSHQLMPRTDPKSE